jgi:hypothetical protein
MQHYAAAAVVQVEAQLVHAVKVDKLLQAL